MAAATIRLLFLSLGERDAVSAPDRQWARAQAEQPQTLPAQPRSYTHCRIAPERRAYLNHLGTMRSLAEVGKSTKTSAIQPIQEVVCAAHDVGIKRPVGSTCAVLSVCYPCPQLANGSFVARGKSAFFRKSLRATRATRLPANGVDNRRPEGPQRFRRPALLSASARAPSAGALHSVRAARELDRGLAQRDCTRELCRRLGWSARAACPSSTPGWQNNHFDMAFTASRDRQ